MSTTQTARKAAFRPAVEQDRFIVLEPNARMVSYEQRRKLKPPASLIDAPHGVEYLVDYILMPSDRLTRDKAIAEAARINAALCKRLDRDLSSPIGWAVAIELGRPEPLEGTIKVNGDGEGEFDIPHSIPVRVVQPTVAEKKAHPLPASNGKAAGGHVNRLAARKAK